MTTVASDLSAPGGPARGRRWRLLVLAVLLGSVMSALGGYVWYERKAPQPPAVDLAGVDPDVAAAIRQEREAVFRSPRSEAAWGQLGLVLAGNDFFLEAATCLAQAERFDDREFRWPYLLGTL